MGRKAEHGRDEAKVEEFIESFAVTLTDAGMPRMPARVFVLLLTHEGDSMTAAEIGAELHVSPAAVSGAVRYLTTTGSLTKSRVRGQRADRYSLGPVAWYEAIVTRNPLLSGMVDGLKGGVDAVGAKSIAGQRMTRTHDFFAFLSRRLPELLAEWREQQ